MQIRSIGIDLGKTTFHLIALGSRSQVVIRKKFSRSQLLVYTANLPASLIGMEAGVGSHFLGRALREQGHQVRLIPAQFVRPFVKSNKNDYRDAEAIAEAVERENMRFVPIKTEDQLDLQALHRVRDRLVARRTSVINQIRAFLLEGNKFSQRAGQPASADTRDSGECRRKTERWHASSVEFSLAGVERLAVADRDPERRPGTDCQRDASCVRLQQISGVGP
jgi:transposase